MPVEGRQLGAGRREGQQEGRQEGGSGGRAGQQEMLSVCSPHVAFHKSRRFLELNLFLFHVCECGAFLAFQIIYIACFFFLTFVCLLVFACKGV